MICAYQKDLGLTDKVKFDNIYSPEFIYKFKEQKMQEIAKTIEETGIQLECVTYWSVSDTLAHNLERTTKRGCTN